MTMCGATTAILKSRNFFFNIPVQTVISYIKETTPKKLELGYLKHYVYSDIEDDRQGYKF